MRIFKTPIFVKWAKSENVTDKMLHESVKEMDRGLIDAKLGDGLCKQRLARVGQGKRGSYRTLIAFKKLDRSVFVFGFAKKDGDNISISDKKKYREFSKFYLNLSNPDLNKLITKKLLIEVTYDKK